MDKWNSKINAPFSARVGSMAPIIAEILYYIIELLEQNFRFELAELFFSGISTSFNYFIGSLPQ